MPQGRLRGLILVGKVMSRRRRTVQSKKQGVPDRFVISLRVEGAGLLYTAEAWSETRMPVGIPDIGDEVELGVEARAYVQAGVARCTLTFGGIEKGEEF